MDRALRAWPASGIWVPLVEGLLFIAGIGVDLLIGVTYETEVIARQERRIEYLEGDIEIAFEGGDEVSGKGYSEEDPDLPGRIQISPILGRRGIVIHDIPPLAV